MEVGINQIVSATFQQLLLWIKMTSSNTSFSQLQLSTLLPVPDKVITTNNVYFPVQATLDGVMISPVFISDDIVKWFPERAAPGEMLESFIDKENRKWREKYEQARNHWLKSVMRPSIVRKIIRPIKAVEKKRILKEIRMRNKKKH